MPCDPLSSPSSKSIQMMNQLKMPFPWKLHHMLEEAENPESGFSNIVSWLPDGKAFKIYDQDVFVDTIMKTYFNQSKIKSFTRQLYIYGFLKIPSGPNEGAFYHPEFLRDDKQSCFSLRRNQAGDRRRIKAASRRGSASSNTSASSADSSQSSAGPSPTVGCHSLVHTKFQRRNSLSDYISGRPSMSFSNLKPLRRSSLGTPLPVSSSMGQPDVDNRRNSLSDFFDHALTLLPSEDTYASLPCLEDLTRQPSIGSLNGFRSTSIEVFDKQELQDPTPMNDFPSSCFVDQYTSMGNLLPPPPLPRAENFVTPTHSSCNFAEMEPPPLSEIQMSTAFDDPLFEIQFQEPSLSELQSRLYQY